MLNKQYKEQEGTNLDLQKSFTELLNAHVKLLEERRGRGGNLCQDMC